MSTTPTCSSGARVTAVQANLNGQLEKALRATADFRDHAKGLGSAVIEPVRSTQLPMRPLCYMGRPDEFLDLLGMSPTAIAEFEAMGMRVPLERALAMR